MQMTATSEPSPIGAHFTELDPFPPGHVVHDVSGTCCDRGAALAMQHLPSAGDHYREACNALARANSNSYDYAAASRLQESARLHVALAELATVLWPQDDADLARVLEENMTMAAELSRLQPVVQAVRALVEANTAGSGAPGAYRALTEALTRLDAA